METHGYRPKSKKLQQKFARQNPNRRFSWASGESILQTGSAEYQRIADSRPPTASRAKRALLSSPLILIAFLAIAVYLTVTQPVVGLIILAILLLGLLIGLVLRLRNR